MDPTLTQSAAPRPRQTGRMGGELGLRERYQLIRAASDALCRPLSPEDCCIQTMPDVSPTKWHMAHTTWFFETFVLARFSREYESRHPAFRVLFNSYYNGVGEQFPRSRRGTLSRPSLAEVLEYRREIDEQLAALLGVPRSLSDELARVVETGLNHEQQHQELMLTDIKHVFWSNPLRPAYLNRESSVESREPERGEPSEFRLSTLDPRLSTDWIHFDGGLTTIGHDGDEFAFDNETPAHDVYLRPFRLASRLVTNRQFLDFIHDGGYRRPELWLSDGWDAVQGDGWNAPLYWQERDGGWWQFTLSGMRPLELDEPVCHVSYFEADAFARWSNARLPTEAEWETAAGRVSHAAGNFVANGRLHPATVASKPHELQQLFGDVWEWTAGPYVAYPGYRPAAGALGEYNGKFMCNQFVLRGGSCVTPGGHIRSTYRNFFQPEKRWQFSGIRLAEDA